MQQKIKHGGKRLGAGRPKENKEATITVAFRVPVSKVEVIKEVVKKKLALYKKRGGK